MRAWLLPTIAAAVLGLCGAPHAQAQDADACAKFKWSIDRERDAFKGKLPTIRSGADYPGVMSGVTVMLDPQAKVTYPVPPARAPKAPTAFGAVVTAPPLAAKGVYQITVSEPVWIDVVQNGKALKSDSFTGQENCPGVRKSVRFNLEAGPMLIELSDATVSQINLDLLPVQ